MDNSYYKDLNEQNCYNPFDLLGWHGDAGAYTVTVYRPGLKGVTISTEKETKVASRIGDGIFSAEFSENTGAHYHVLYRGQDGKDHDEIDPYSFPPYLSSFDIYLYKEGNLQYAYRTFGSHFQVRDEIEGTRFVLWAPNARSVSVVGDFNLWDPRKFCMHTAGFLPCKGICQNC